MSADVRARTRGGWRELPLRRWSAVAARHAVLLFFCAVVLVPLIWIASSSLKSVQEQYRVPATFLPLEPTLESYVFVLRNIPLLPNYYANSIVVAFTSTFGTVGIACLAGYAFGRLT